MDSLEEGSSPRAAGPPSQAGRRRDERAAGLFPGEAVPAAVQLLRGTGQTVASAGKSPPLDRPRTVLGQHRLRADSCRAAYRAPVSRTCVRNGGKTSGRGSRAEQRPGQGGPKEG